MDIINLILNIGVLAVIGFYLIPKLQETRDALAETTLLIDTLLAALSNNQITPEEIIKMKDAGQDIVQHLRTIIKKRKVKVKENV